MNQTVRKYSPEDLDLIEEFYNIEARNSFWAYRQLVNPGFIKGWFQRDIAINLQAFYVDLVAGKRPALVIATPPQHGKSDSVKDFAAWASGKNKKLRTIYTSYSDELGEAANGKLQRIFDGRRHQQIFGRQIASSRSNDFTRNSSLLEFVCDDGSNEEMGHFRNTTVEGQITGMGLGLGIIDDPIKGRAAARSKTVRDKIWDWFTDDFFSRFSEQAGMIMIMTRWHVDDPVGRFIEKFPHARVLNYAAIAEKDETYRKQGEALFPEFKSLDFLLERKKIMRKTSWEGLYQQNPLVEGGGMFERAWFEIVEAYPSDCRWIRHWDLAATKDDGAYTAGVLLGYSPSTGFYYVADVKRTQSEGDVVRSLIKQTSMTDRQTYGRFGRYEISLPQDPGQAGKVQAKDMVKMLDGFNVHAELESGDKELRAEPFAAQAEAGNVKLLLGPWNTDYLDELEVAPGGKYMDQVDASSGAYGRHTMHPVRGAVTATVVGLH